MKKKLLRTICMGSFAILSCIGAFGQATSVTENFDNNIVPASFRAGQGFFLTAVDQRLKVKVGKQQWEEFSYDVPLNLSANPRVSFKIRGDNYFQIVLAFVDAAGNHNRFPDNLASVFPSNDFIDVSFDMTGLLQRTNATAVDPSQITSIRFMIDPACEKSVNLEIDDFKVGSTAQLFPRMIAPITQSVYVGSPQQTVLLRGMLAGSTATASSTNPGLITNISVGAPNANGTAELKYTPAAGQSGSARINVTVRQTGKSNLVVPFTVNVNANLAPTINPVGPQTIGSGQTLTVPLSGISDGNTEKTQNVSFTATSSDQTVIKNSNISIDYANPFTNGKLTFKTEALASGTKDAVITLTAKDDGSTTFGGVDSKSITIPVKIYAVYYKSPTIASISNNNFAYVGTPYTIPLTGITDGNGGSKVTGITASSSNTAAVNNPVVNYTPGSNTGTLTYTLKNKQSSTISVIVTNSGAPANSNGNTSTTITFEVKGVDPAYTGFVEDFQSYGVDGTNPTPNVFGADYYSSGTGGDDRVGWMTNLDAYGQKWFVEGQGAEQTFSLNTANKSAVLAVDKPSSVPRTFAGLWYSPRKLFDLSNNKYLSLKISAVGNTKVTFDIFDVNNKRYGLLPTQNVTSTPTTVTFVFDKAPTDADFDFSKVSAILFNTLPLLAYKGTITISDLKIGDKADNAPAAKPAEIMMLAPANRTIFASTPGIDIQLSDIAVIKEGLVQNANVNLSVTSSNPSLIPAPAAPLVVNKTAVLELKPRAGQTGKATFTITATSSGIATKTYTFDVDVINKNAGSAGTVTINQSQTFQTVQGIGAEPADVENLVGDAGASMLRFDIGGEYSGLEAENDNSDPFVLDITKFNFNDRYDFLKTKAMGCDRVIGCVWTPPIWMKGVYAYRPQTHLGTRNSLLPEMYDEFVEYILGACLAFKNKYGYEMYSVCLQNEAEFYSSTNLTATCGYTKEQAAEIVRRTYPRLKAAGLTTRIHGFDQLPAQNNVLNWFQYFNNTDTKDMFDAFSIHAYGANAIDPAQLDNARLKEYYTECQRVNPKKELWMTETSGGPTGEAGGVEEIASEFNALANNLSVWTPLHITKADGMRFYAMKSFAKFIRPGAVRIGTSNSGGAAGLAFKHDVNKTYTVVLVNTGSTAQQVKLAGTNGMPAKMYAYLTANNINCQFVDSVTSADNFLVNVPARSVVTLYNKFEDQISSNDEAVVSNLEMVVYPNPSNGEMSLILPNDKYTEISVIDISGRTILIQAIKPNGMGVVDLNLFGLQKGMYIISAKGETTLRKKIIID